MNWKEKSMQELLTMTQEINKEIEFRASAVERGRRLLLTKLESGDPRVEIRAAFSDRDEEQFLDLLFDVAFALATDAKQSREDE